MLLIYVSISSIQMISHLLVTTVTCALLLAFSTQPSAATSSADTSLHTSSSGASSVLSLNISYWQASAVFPGNRHRRAYSTVQLPSVKGANYPDEILVMGGVDAFEEGEPTVYGDTWKSVDEGNSWTRVADFPARFLAAACVTPELNILVIGGVVNYPNYTQSTDSYISRDRGVTWTKTSSQQPFYTGSPHCTVDSTGKFVFVWAGNVQFRPDGMQLFRAPYSDATGIGEWVGFKTPAADGKPLVDRVGFALQFLVHSNQLVIGGGNTISAAPAMNTKEVLSLTLPMGNQSEVAWTRTIVTADWPTSQSTYNRFALDFNQNVYFFAEDDSSDNVAFQLWFSAASATSWDSWVPIDLNSSCGVTWNPVWVTPTGILLSSIGGTDRFIILDQDLLFSTLLIPLNALNQQSTGIVANESFVPVTSCLPPDDGPSHRHLTWPIIVVIVLASALVISIGVYCSFCRKKPTQPGVNSPLLRDV